VTGDHCRYAGACGVRDHTARRGHLAEVAVQPPPPGGLGRGLGRRRAALDQARIAGLGPVAWGSAMTLVLINGPVAIEVHVDAAIERSGRVECREIRLHAHRAPPGSAENDHSPPSLSLISSLIHPGTPASIGVYDWPLSS